ncbi:MAG: glutathione S-transferase [Rhodothermales bacterium]|jgi:glutathione S-transferase
MSTIAIYGFSFSPFVRKLCIQLDEKGIAYENIPMPPRDLPAELAVHSPLGKIPFARIGDDWLADSSVIASYLERIYPEKPLYPNDPLPRARADWYEEYIDGNMVGRLVFKIFFQHIVNPLFMNQPCDEEKVQDAIENDLPEMLSYLDGKLGEREFLVGDSLSMADITVGSLMLNLAHCDISADAEKYPNMARYTAALHARPSFQKLAASEAAFFASRRG